MRQIAMVMENEVRSIAVWAGDADWIEAMHQSGYILIDVTDLPSVAIGWLYNEGELTQPPSDLI